MTNAEQPTDSFEPVSQREVVVAYIERERELWLPAYHRAQRASGMSAAANVESAELFKPIDKLLDELSALGRTAVGGV